jgi:hypothetical protein
MTLLGRLHSSWDAEKFGYHGNIAVRDGEGSTTTEQLTAGEEGLPMQRQETFRNAK